METIHYQEFGYPECGARKGEMTAIPKRVTCKRCKKTKSYLEMMEAIDESNTTEG